MMVDELLLMKFSKVNLEKKIFNCIKRKHN